MVIAVYSFVSAERSAMLQCSLLTTLCVLDFLRHRRWDALLIVRVDFSILYI